MAAKRTKPLLLHPFRLSASDFVGLPEADFNGAVNELIRLEALANEIPLSALDLTWKEKAPDAGVDASTENRTTNVDFVPVARTIWQFKASGLIPSKVYGELHKSGKKKRTQLLAELAAGADYVLILGEDPGVKGKKERARELKRAMKAAGSKLPGHIVTAAELELRAARHASLVLLPQFRRPLGGMMRHDTWKASDRLRRPFRATEDQAAIVESIRRDLLGGHHGPGVYRVTGKSGLGKTRAVLEALDDEQLRAKVMYAIGPKHLPPPLLSWLRDEPQARAILVVDECDLPEQQRVRDMLAGAEERVPLIAIGPESARLSGGVGRFDLKPADAVELDAILNAISPDLSHETRRYIIRLSSGYVRMAVLLAESFLRDGTRPPAAVAEEEEVSTYLERLVGPNPSSDLMATLRATALFSELGFDDELEVELRTVAPLVAADVPRLRNGLLDCERRELLHGRGRRRFVTPEILAMRIAGEFWGARGGELRAFYDRIPTAEMRERFLERLVSLGEDSRTVPVLEGLLSSKEVFRGLEDLKQAERGELLRHLATAHPVAGARALQRLLGGATVAELLALNGGRRAVVSTLEQLVWLRETFESSAEILLALAEAENERYANNATGIWHQLFRPQLSGTEVPGLERLALLEGIMSDEGRSERQRELALEALLHVFETHVARSSAMDSLGGKPLPPEWRPRTVGDFRAVVDRAFAMLERAMADSTLQAKATEGFLQTSRTLFAFALGDQAVARFRQLMEQPDAELRAAALRAINTILAYDREDLSATQVTSLGGLQARTMEADFGARLRRWLGPSSPGDFKLEDEDPRAQEREARKLATELWSNRALLEQEWSWLLSEAAQRSWFFFVELGERDEDHALTERVEALLKSSEAPSATYAWTALLAGHRQAERPAWVDERIHAAAQASETAPAALEALWRAEPTEDAALLIADMVARGVLPPSQVGRLVYGNWIGRTSVAAARAIVGSLIELNSPTADFAALALLGMRLRRHVPSVAEFREHVWTVLDRTSVGGQDTMDSHHWGQLAQVLVAEDPGRLVRALVKAFAGEDYISDRDERVKVLLDCARHDPAATWSTMADAALKNWRVRLSVRHAMAGRLETTVPEQVILDWIEAHGVAGATLVAELSPLGPTLTPIQRHLLMTFPDAKDVQSALTANLHTGAFSGSIHAWLNTKAAWVRNWSKDSDRRIRVWATELADAMEAEAQKERTREEERGY